MTRRRHLVQPQHRGISDDERILPLINIVFLLLIFFMVAGQLAASDRFAIEPPSSGSETEPAGRITVLVGTDQRLAVGGESVAMGALSDTVLTMLDAGSNRQVRVKADGRVPALRVVAIMEQLRDAGAEGIDLLTVTGSE
ncbi:ExbD/TolR family protein [Spiribacter vilamensis]|uniref:Outer membrane transport energization protein ExbD n=1 Tax=Spiribacter vilamensis TaxID=531306 RepID=A0A4Q8D062_9GAMM|nr:biopolymer transporter ExbD [Spiribacter vilamensis]RZU98701.1 outer membrane transport energization protein ExbD [Spiribacter vilamensis]TVO62273.1 biopolymer transporter ExbD [Spiribacter vilamensis]